MLAAAASLAAGGLAHVAGDPDGVVAPLERQQLAALPGHEQLDDVEQLPVPRGGEHRLAVPDEAEGDLRMGQGLPLQNAVDGAGLGHIAFHILIPGGHAEKHVPHHDGGAVRAPGGALLQLLTVFNGIRPAHLLLPGLGQDLHMGHRRDGGQCLSPEAQGADALQILRRAQLAGGVAQKGGGHLLLGNTAAVVGDADIGGSAVADLGGDALRPGVDGVLHQLLHHRGGPLHHLARGDHVSHLLGQDLNMSHRCPSSQCPASARARNDPLSSIRRAMGVNTDPLMS